MKKTTTLRQTMFRSKKNICFYFTCISIIFTVQLNAQLANGKPKFVGNIIGNFVPGNYDSYWNQITPENSSKWSEMEPNEGTFAWESNNNTPLVQAYNKAKNKGYKFKAHTFVWGNQTPGWMYSKSAAQQKAAIDRIMYGYFDRFPDTDFVDVVNEALDGHAPARGGNGWMKFNGDNDIGKWSWIKWSFERARAARNAKGSNAKLLLNDYSIVENDQNTQTYIDLIKAVNANGRNLIEGIGVQAHFAYNANGCGNYNEDYNKIKRNLDKLAALGLPIYVAELDVNIGNDSDQERVLLNLFKIFYEHNAVKGVTLWGYNKNQTWIPCSWLVDGSNERPALKQLRAYLQGDTGGGDGGDITNGGIYTIKTKNNKCVDVSSNSTSNGANIHQWDCHGGSNQKWQLNSRGSGYYEIKSIRSGKCLDVANISNNNGANIQQYNCGGGFNQQWKVTSIGDGKYTLTARHSNKCLDLSGGSSNNGANLQQYNCNSSNQNQHFTFSTTNRVFNNDTDIELAKVTELLIFPNPSNSELNLKIPGIDSKSETTIDIYDALGRKVLSRTTSKDFVTLDVQRLDRGNYYLKTTTNGERTIKNFIKN